MIKDLFTKNVLYKYKIFVIYKYYILILYNKKKLNIKIKKYLINISF